MTNIPVAEAVPTVTPIKDQKVDRPLADPSPSSTSLKDTPLMKNEPKEAFQNLRKAIETLNNVPLSTLPQNLREQYSTLCKGEKIDGSKMSDQDYEQTAASFMDGIKNMKGTPLDKKQKENVDELGSLFSSGKVKKEQAMSALKEFVNDPKNEADPEKRKVADELLTEFNNEIDQSAPNREKIKEKFGKVLKIFKMVGMAIAALLSMGLFKVIMGGGRR